MNRHHFLAVALVLLVPVAACSSDVEGDGSGGGGGDEGGAGGGGAGGGGEAGGGAGPDCTYCDETNAGQVCPMEDDCYDTKVCELDLNIETYGWVGSFTHEQGDPCSVEAATCSTIDVWGEHCDYTTKTATCTGGAWQLEVETMLCGDDPGEGGAGG